MSKRPKYKGKRLPPMKKTCIAAVFEMDRLRDHASDHGITIKCHETSCCKGNVKTLHVMFEHSGRRLLEYWPGTGRTWRKANGAKDKVSDPYKALDAAIAILENEAQGIRG